MGTRSFIGEPVSDTWRARYCHWDGYPTAKGRDLVALVRRDGVETVRQRLLHDRYGWSSIDPNQIDVTKVELPPEDDNNKLDYMTQFKFGTPEYEAASFRSCYGDGRFACEPGYGIAYTTKDGQSKEDEWITPDTGDWGTEWGYILGDKALFVFKVDGGVKFFGFGEDRIGVQPLAVVPYDDDTDWEAIEKSAYPDED